jgi:hypothetical protein
MGDFRRGRVWLALALLPMLTAGQVVAQGKDPKKDSPTEKSPKLLSYKPLEPKDGDDELRKLQIARYNEAIEEIKALRELVLIGSKRPGDLSDAGKRVCQSGSELYDDPMDRIRLLTDYVEFTKYTEKVFEALLTAGRLAKANVIEARANRIEAEIELLKAQSAEKAKNQ